MTSLFSRLQKLNKEATPALWRPVMDEATLEMWIEMPDPREGRDGMVRASFDPARNADAPLIVECRNSLPAVLNLIEAAQRAVTTRDVFESGTDDDSDSDELFHAWQEAMDVLREAVAVFVSGQEEPR